MLIKGGYFILVCASTNEVLKQIDLEEHDLEKSIARADVMNDIQEAIEGDMKLHG